MRTELLQSAKRRGRDAYEFDFEFIGRSSSDKADSIRCSINLESDSNSKTSRRSFVRSYMRACDNTRCEATHLRIRATNAIDRSKSNGCEFKCQRMPILFAEIVLSYDTHGLRLAKARAMYFALTDEQAKPR